MNTKKLEKVLSHLHVQNAFPTRIDAKVLPSFDPRVSIDTFTRVNWSASEISVAELEFENKADGETLYLLKFLANTRTRVVRIGPDGIPPDTEEVNDDDVILDLIVDFAVEYAVVGCTPADLDEEGMAEFTAHNMPYHLWPYYREFAQNTALRMRVPLPTIPSFRVPKSHQRATGKRSLPASH